MWSIFTRIAALALIAAPFALINSPAQATVNDSFTTTATSALNLVERWR